MPPKKKPPATAQTPLTPLEWDFVGEYVRNHGNATQAYMFVSPKVTYGSARALAAKLLAKINVKNAVAREFRRAARKRGVNAERALEEVAHLAYTHIGQVIDPKTLAVRKNIPPEVWRAIAQVETVTTGTGDCQTTRVKVRMHGKVEALDRIFRHLGLYKDLPPLETILALLPPAVAAVIRGELARALPAGGDPPGGGGDPGPDPLPEWAEPDGAGGGDGDPAGPELPVPGDEVDPGPVAGELPAEPAQADADVVLPTGGEERQLGGPDPGPLFDDA